MPDKSNIAAADEQLVEATLQGDISSFGIIVERYWDMVIAFAISKIDNAIDAEDIAQECFLKAYSQLHRLRNPSRFAGWLSKIAAQQCVNHIRKNAHRRITSSYTTYDVDTSAQAVACNSNPGLTDEQICFVRQTVSRLPEKFHKVIIMRFVFVFLPCGCSSYEQPGETAAEGRRRHQRTLRINQQQMMADLDTLMLLDKPSKLTDKRIP